MSATRILSVARIPIPKPSYLDKCRRLKVSGEQRWLSPDGERILTWDSLHGEVEMFNKRGRHLGVLDPNGEPKKDAVKGRKIDV